MLFCLKNIITETMMATIANNAPIDCHIESRNQSKIFVFPFAFKEDVSDIDGVCIGLLDSWGVDVFVAAETRLTSLISLRATELLVVTVEIKTAANNDEIAKTTKFFLKVSFSQCYLTAIKRI